MLTTSDCCPSILIQLLVMFVSKQSSVVEVSYVQEMRDWAVEIER
jgi:hypothetical protein